MKTTISELCDKALEHILSIDIKNKDVAYSPSDSLKNGNTIKTFNFNITVPDINQSVTKNATIDIKTNETIPEEYLKATSNSNIETDWNNYKTKYIYNKLNSERIISVSSMFEFLYLFRYFIDMKFSQFTDIYGQSNVWLYNTADVTYSPSFSNENVNVLDIATTQKYMDILISEISARKTLKVLNASSSTSSCSSSSCSSSCSSSSSSSSCSCSSSSSSLFIAYFNLG